MSSSALAAQNLCNPCGQLSRLPRANGRGAVTSEKLLNAASLLAAFTDTSTPTGVNWLDVAPQIRSDFGL